MVDDRIGDPSLDPVVQSFKMDYPFGRGHYPLFHHLLIRLLIPDLYQSPFLCGHFKINGSK